MAPQHRELVLEAAGVETECDTTACLHGRHNHGAFGWHESDATEEESAILCNREAEVKRDV